LRQSLAGQGSLNGKRTGVYDPREESVPIIRPEDRGDVTDNEILLERGHSHGNAIHQFALAQNIKAWFRSGSNWEKLTPQQRETFEMIATKMSRILEGDPAHLEHWKDIWGYAELQALMMEGKAI
jgi:hypothetical protein